MEAVHFSPNRVGVKVVREHFQCIAMQPKRVFLRIIHQHGILCGMGIAFLLIVPEIVAMQFVFVTLVVVYHITETFCRSFLLITEEAIANHLLFSIHQSAPSEQSRTVPSRIEISFVSVHNTLPRSYRRRSHHMRFFRHDIVIKRICHEQELLVFQVYIVVEFCFLQLCVILSPVAGQHIFLVHHFTAFKEIAQIVKTVIVKRVGVQHCTPMFQDHIPAGTCHLLVTVIESIFTIQRQGISLTHLYVTESLKRIAGFEEIGAVASEMSTFVAERHMSVKYLGIRLTTKTVVRQPVGMLQIHSFIHLLARLFLTRSLHAQCETKGQEAQNQHESLPMPPQ